MVCGVPLMLPGVLVSGQEQPPDFFVELLRYRVSSFSPIQKKENSVGGLQQLQRAKFVYTKAPPPAPVLLPAYRGPNKVLEAGPKVFHVLVGGKPDMISVDQLKPHLRYSPSEAHPPRRGRPAAANSSSPGSDVGGAL
jgi:hypothetical protein